VSLIFRAEDTSSNEDETSRHPSATRSRGRRVHLLFLAPSFEAVERLVALINPKGKLASDGRPVLRMSCRDFALACAEADEQIMIIPAHIWTPWFGLLGSKSGFDSIEEAFGDQASRIHAYETGLSSDPPMCWRVESLNKRVLVSSSDLHSGPNMMREATLLHSKVSDYDYSSLREVLTVSGHKNYYGTLEFFPQEGKYHADGHAACRVVMEPEKTKALGGLCPVCGRPLTVGVNHRVLDLASYAVDYKPKYGGVVIYAVPLQEIIAAALDKGKQSKAVQSLYDRLVDSVDTEYALLHERKEFPAWVPERVVAGIQKVRDGDVIIDPGYDGVYGKVNLFQPSDTKMSLWA